VTSGKSQRPIYNSRNFNEPLNGWNGSGSIFIYNSRNFNEPLNSPLDDAGTESTTVEISMNH